VSIKNADFPQAKKYKHIAGRLNKLAMSSSIAKTGIRRILRKDGLPIVSILFAKDLFTNITLYPTFSKVDAVTLAITLEPWYGGGNCATTKILLFDLLIFLNALFKLKRPYLCSILYLKSVLLKW
jgi:hypothetical protein